MKFEILSRIKSVFKDMSAFKTFRNIKTGVYQSEIGDNVRIPESCWTAWTRFEPTKSERSKVDGPK